MSIMKMLENYWKNLNHFSWLLPLSPCRSCHPSAQSPAVASLTLSGTVLLSCVLCVLPLQTCYFSRLQGLLRAFALTACSLCLEVLPDIPFAQLLTTFSEEPFLTTDLKFLPTPNSLSLSSRFSL